jgi:Raf kinase inhibitor-like YbhB/YbcL family protein
VKGLSVLLILAGLTVMGCGGNGASGTELEQGPSVAAFQFTDQSDVAEGEPIQARFTCDGEDIPPRLAWEGVPENTQELVLALEDPDAPGATFTHWLVYGIDPGMTTLTDVGVLLEGENDFGDTGYGGPCPPGGEEHRYVFRLFALDAHLGLEPGADRAAFDEAVAPRVLAEARLTATYARP